MITKTLVPILLAVVLAGCATLNLSVEIRQPHSESSRVERIHLAQPSSLGSSKRDPRSSVEDTVYRYYEHNGLIDATTIRSYLVVDLPPSQTNAPYLSAVYCLSRPRLRISETWSAWRAPDYVVQAAASHDVAFRLFNGQPVSTLHTNATQPQMRYKISYWRY